LNGAALPLTLYRIEETASVDAFSLPSIFDGKLRLYQEWHDFVFFDHTRRIFGLLNFGVHGNPYDSKRGWGSVLSYIVNPQEKIFTEIKLIPMDKLEVSSFSPNFISKTCEVTFLKDYSFEVQGHMEKVEFDLNFRVAEPPVSNKDIFLEIMRQQEPNVKMMLAAREMSRQWDSWVELPRLIVKGKLKLGNETYQIETSQGYQDHEGCSFDISTTWGWDTGVVLCDPSAALEPRRVDFLFYRYGPTSSSSYGGIFFETKKGEKVFFDSENTMIDMNGNYKGSLNIMPGITKLLYPDYHPKISKETTLTSAKGTDSLEITFTPKAVCCIVNTSLLTDSEVVFNEMFCDAHLHSEIAGNKYDCIIPSWFESVRPRKRGGQLCI